MDAAEPAAKLSALEAELAAKSSRVAELEAVVSLLEAENARLRAALAEGEAAGRAGKGDPKSGRLAAGLRGSRHEVVEKLVGSVACDVIEVSDDDEGAAAAVGANKGRTPPDGGVVATSTPRKLAVRVLTGGNEDEAGPEDAEGGGGSSKEDGAGLEDDDVSITSRGKKRAAARVVTSDSEDEDVMSGDELGSGKEKEEEEEDARGHEEGPTPSRKRAFHGLSDSDNEDGTAQIESSGEEDENDRIPIRQLLKKMRKERVSDDGAELGEAKGCSTPVTRRSARLLKNQSKREQPARRALNFVEPEEREGSEDDSEEDDDDMDEFINDEESSENAGDSAEESRTEPEDSGASAPNEESSPEPGESDGEINYKDVMDSIGRRRKGKDWKFQGEMLAAFDKHPDLCLKAVCALYRRQTEVEQLEKATIFHNKQGFSQIDASRGSRIAEFLLDGDLYGPIKKTISDLEEYDRYALEFCHKVASRYSKQLFEIYQNKEDPYFHP